MNDILRNPGHNFGYIQLPANLEIFFNCPVKLIGVEWPIASLIEKEIFKSELDVLIRIGDEEPQYIGKAVSLATKPLQRFLRIDTTNASSAAFKALRNYVVINRPVCQHRPYLASSHIDSFITGVKITADLLEDGDMDSIATNTDSIVLNQIVITLAG